MISNRGIKNHKKLITRLGLLVSVCFFAVHSVGCGGGGGSSGSTSEGNHSSVSTVSTYILNGVAAVGTPIVNANVSVMCAVGSLLSTTTSSTGGIWQVNLSGQTLPCAVELSNGTINGVTNAVLYHTIAVAAGTANITPFTDLMVANIVGTTSLGTWFAQITKNPSPLANITQSRVNTALAALSVSLRGLPFSTNNPITTPFTPTTGDTSDDMLTAFTTAISKTPDVTYASLLSYLTAATATTTTVPTAFVINLTSAYSFIPSGSRIVGGSVSGLTGSVVLQNNGGSDLTVSTNGTFSFSASVDNSDTYHVTVLTQPSGQTCSVTGGSGRATANVNDVAVVCTATPISTTTGQNVMPIIVDSGPAGVNAINIPYTSVTLCTPGTTTCQTIGHIIVDTGSSGLRIIASVLSSSLSLTPKTSGTGNLYECARFIDSYSWGAVKVADVKLAGEPTLSSLAVHIIGEPNAPSAPRGCTRTGGASGNTVESFGGNGIIGVGLFQQDCGSACVTAPSSTRAYYTCASASRSSCTTVGVPLAQQIQNPVGMLPTDNNGVVVTMPAVAATGSYSVSGSLILGISTQTNNIRSGTVYKVDPTYGTLTTLFDGQSYAGSFLDSGSNALYFASKSITPCTGNSTGFYCPSSALQLTATNQGTDGASGTINFTVVNADALFKNTAYTAASGLAGIGTSGFDWGFPFFFGRTVFTAIEGKSSGGVSGPYYAY